MNTPQEFTVLIQNLSSDGEGIVSLPPKNKPIHIPFVLLNEVVQTKISGKTKKNYQADLPTILQNSPFRIIPRCVHFQTCGGCRWQHMSYPYQLQIKQQRIEKLFARWIEKEPSISYPILPSVKEWGYRNKMEFSFSSDRKGTLFLGLMKLNGKGKVENLQECHLASPWFLECVSLARTWAESEEITVFHPMKNRGTLRTLTVREGARTGDRMVILTVSGNPEDALHQDQIRSFCNVIKQIEPLKGKGNLSIFLRIHQAIQGQITQFFEMHLYGAEEIYEHLWIQSQSNELPKQYTFKISPSAFFQPNPYQAELLYSRALQLFNIKNEEIIYDLYCGTATLGISLANQVKKVIGIELSPEALLDAQENKKINNAYNVELIQGAVEKKIDDPFTMQEEGHITSVIVDPPRTGLHQDAIQSILKARPKKILYISCNPDTQHRDAEILAQGGYSLCAIQPVDQFPHTPHLENIIIFHLQT